MPNRLADERSPYLLQHKENPVDWYPWGDAAFEKAKREDKPVFLSIGYSTCHWCHVMEKESFEDEAVARLMNEAFVSIKVDREERPDIDHLYMTVCQLMGQQGGWPLNVLLTPEGEPFHAMTYLPKESRFGRMGMTEFVPRIRQLWQEERARVLDSAGSITETLEQAARQAPAGAALREDVLENAFEQFSSRFDAAQGGFGSAPKFPSPHTLLFLLRYARRTGEDRPLRMVEKTLDAMRLGGIFDHVGFGFHRYSTDARWLVPHFEKMLYDQALLALAYTEGFQATGTAAYEQTAREIFAYVLRDLTDEAGSFYSAEDADSEGREGAFYLWTTKAIQEALPDEQAALVTDVYTLEEDGNFAEEASGQKTGENIIHLQQPLGEIATERGMDEADLREKLEAARRALFASREERERPGLDDKILTDWNGLFIAALAKAARVFEAPEFAEAAEKAAAFLLETMRDDAGRLLHRFRGGEAAIRAQLDDYAFLAFGCLELYETTYAVRWLRAALDLTETLRTHFLDEEHGGFFLTADDGEQLLVRQKGFYDGAIPSGNSVALWNLLRLARLTGRADLEEGASRLTQAAAAQVRRQPSGFAALLCGLDVAFGPAFEVVVAGAPAADDTTALLRALHAAYTPNAVTLLRPDTPEQEAPPEITALAPFTEAQRAVDGQAAAYVCQEFQCQAPTTDAAEMLAALKGH